VKCWALKVRPPSPLVWCYTRDRTSTRQLSITYEIYKPPARKTDHVLIVPSLRGRFRRIDRHKDSIQCRQQPNCTLPSHIHINRYHLHQPLLCSSQYIIGSHLCPYTTVPKHQLCSQTLHVVRVSLKVMRDRQRTKTTHLMRDIIRNSCPPDGSFVSSSSSHSTVCMPGLTFSAIVVNLTARRAHQKVRTRASCASSDRVCLPADITIHGSFKEWMSD
jgi:hypothetical protein